MKEAELRKLATCGVCGQKIGHTGLPSFWRVKVERYLPDEDMAKQITEVSIPVCETCAMEQRRTVYDLAEGC